MTVAAAQPQREHILDVALRLMAEHGAAGVSMRQLARECGIQVAAIYHYFESKDALLTAVISERNYAARLADPPALDPEASAPDRLRTIWDAIWVGALEEEAIWRLLLGEGLRGEPAAVTDGHELLGVFQTGTAAWVGSWVPEITDPAGVTRLLIGQLFLCFIRRIFDPAVDVTVIGAEAADALISAAFA